MSDPIMMGPSSSQVELANLPGPFPGMPASPSPSKKRHKKKKKREKKSSQAPDEELPVHQRPRFVYAGSNKVNDEFCTNYIRTTKYRFWNFLPVNLFEQLRKKANFYFLIIAVLSTTEFSPKTPIVSVVPLLFVLAVTAVKEGYEDYQRYKMDLVTNGTLVTTYRDGDWLDIAWADVEVGDVLMIREGQAFPADMLLLQSSARQGICNIETSNLDGETNLKIKQAVSATYSIRASADGLDYAKRVDVTIQSSAPSEKMDRNSWQGNIVELNGDTRTVPLGFSQLLLRGCSLRNTKWIITMVLFTGLDTKLMMQNKANKFKRSNIEVTVDRALYVIFTLEAGLCVFGAVFYSIWLQLYAEDSWYLPFEMEDMSLNSEAGLAMFTYLVLLDTLVPISLYVSMEMVKFIQAWYINQDLDMYYEVNDIPAHARTSNLNEELGQVSFVFSDKTGTLTRNEMEFLRCSVAGYRYGPGMMRRSGEVVERPAVKKGIPEHDERFRFEDNRLLNNVLNKHDSAKTITEFLTCLAVCHTVVPEFPDDDRTQPVVYQAASPDEFALVQAAKDEQFFFYSREPVKFNFRGRTLNGQRVKVNILGKKHNFDVLEILEFNSTRKRMSVVLLDPRDRKIKIFCKGADNVIRARCNARSLKQFWRPTERHLRKFAAEGLRTLCIASRVVPGAEWDEWIEQHEHAKTAIHDREVHLQESYARIEKEFDLLGATAIEDRLQDGVPEAIARLARGGMRIWMLTGDKTETAINIGRSCKLLTPRMRNENLMVVTVDDSLDDLEAKAQTLEALQSAHEHLKKLTDVEKEDTGIVISGRSLGFVFPPRKLDKKKRPIIPPPTVLAEERKLQQRFLGICTQCKSVICCRVSPKQKSQIVRLVREYRDDITLAIGDGANDVAMIEAAHVGIGIEGREGKQATMASDYSIGQFRFLLNLLMVHGQWNYRRLSLLILYSFYKNVTVTLTQIWFQFYTGFSGAIYYDASSGALYNMLFTAFPVICAAVFNRDISKQGLIKYPEIYKSGPANEFFNLKLLIWVIIEGCYQSVVLFYSSIFTFDTTTKEDGTDNGQWVMATAMYTATVIVVNLKIAMQTTTWVYYSRVFWWASIASWFAWGVLYTAVVEFNPDTYWVFFRLLWMGTFWWYILCIPVACLLPDLVWEFMRRTFFFTRQDIIQEREHGHHASPDLVYDEIVSETKGPLEVQVQHEPTRQDEQDYDDEEDVLALQYPDLANNASHWRALSQAIKADNLGYVPFLEEETGDTFVMGQREFLDKYLAVKKGDRRTYNIPEARHG